MADSKMGNAAPQPAPVAGGGKLGSNGPQQGAPVSGGSGFKMGNPAPQAGAPHLGQIARPGPITPQNSAQYAQAQQGAQGMAPILQNMLSRGLGQQPAPGAIGGSNPIQSQIPYSSYGGGQFGGKMGAGPSSGGGLGGNKMGGSPYGGGKMGGSGLSGAPVSNLMYGS